MDKIKYFFKVFENKCSILNNISNFKQFKTQQLT